MTPSILFVSLVFLGLSMLVSGILKSKFSAYGKIPLASGLTGKQIAEKMLREYGIYEVQVTSTKRFFERSLQSFNKNG